MHIYAIRLLQCVAIDWHPARGYTHPFVPPPTDRGEQSADLPPPNRLAGRVSDLDDGYWVVYNLGLFTSACQVTRARARICRMLWRLAGSFCQPKCVRKNRWT